MTIQIGGVVELRSGGPQMTVQQTFSGGSMDLPSVRCTWFHPDNHLQYEGRFHPDSLVAKKSVSK